MRGYRLEQEGKGGGKARARMQQSCGGEMVKAWPRQRLWGWMEVDISESYLEINSTEMMLRSLVSAMLFPELGDVARRVGWSWKEEEVEMRSSLLQL